MRTKNSTVRRLHAWALTQALVAMVVIGGGWPAVAQVQDPGRQPRSPRAARPESAPASPVNLNTASASDLEALPGIGPATATRIVEYRQKNGPFKKIEDLMNIKGIGEKGFLKLKPLVTVASTKTD